MNGTVQVLLTTLGAATAMMFLVWIFSLIRKDASVVDIFWGLGFVLIAWTAAATGDAPTDSKLVICGVVTLWGLRLAIYIFKRNWGHGEDYRYRAMREKHGRLFPLKSLYLVFGFQALLMWIISLPIQIVQAPATPDGLSLVLLLGALISLLGLLFEAVSDHQLKLFKSDPSSKGKVMDRGLWRYSRHPNYFGESVVWWGLGIAALSVNWGFVTLLSPALITFLLIKFSGVPLLEEKMAATRPGYREYMERTSSFIPFPPKQRKML